MHTSLIAPLVRQLLQAASPAYKPAADAGGGHTHAIKATPRELPQIEVQRRNAILRLVREVGQIPLPLLIQLIALRCSVAPTTADKSIRAMRQDGVLAATPLMYDSRQTFKISEAPCHD